MNNCYHCVEEKIMFEGVYDWKKHFLFHLPDLIVFFVKWLLIAAIVQILLSTAVVVGLASSLDLSDEQVEALNNNN